MQKFCNSPFVVAIDFFLFDIKREVSWHSCCSRLTYWLIQIYDPSGKLNAASFTSSQYVSKALVGYKIMETLKAFRTFDIVPLDLLFLPHIVKPEGRVQFIRCHPKAALYRFAQKLNRTKNPTSTTIRQQSWKHPQGICTNRYHADYAFLSSLTGRRMSPPHLLPCEGGISAFWIKVKLQQKIQQSEPLSSTPISILALITVW